MDFSGEIEKAASYLSEDFKVFNGNSKDKDNEGGLIKLRWLEI